MIYYFSKHMQLLNRSIISMIISYILLRLIWIFEQEAICTFLFRLTAMKVETIDFLIDTSFLLEISLLLYLLINRHLKLHVRANDQYKMLFHANPMPMWIFNSKTFKFIEVNQTASRIFGYGLEEFNKMNILHITSSKDEGKLMNDIKNISGEYLPTNKYELVKKDGELIMATVTAQRIEYRNRECIMVMAEDVTLKIHQEEALKLLHITEKLYKEELECNIKQLNATLQEKQRLAEVIDRIYNVVIITDPYGVITWVNEAFINTTGYPFDEAVGKSPDLLHGPKTDKAFYKEVMASIRQKDFFSFEIVNYTKSGKGYWVEVTVSAVHDEESKVVRYICVQNTITERKFRDIQILEQNSVLKRLAWNNSHIVRKPIASILSLVELGQDMERIEEIKEIQRLIGVCSIELDNITKEVSERTTGPNLDGFMEV
jgi:PAS domain S-box-containing protein